MCRYVCVCVYTQMSKVTEADFNEGLGVAGRELLATHLAMRIKVRLCMVYITHYELCMHTRGHVNEICALAEQC